MIGKKKILNKFKKQWQVGNLKLLLSSNIAGVWEATTGKIFSKNLSNIQIIDIERNWKFNNKCWFKHDEKVRTDSTPRTINRSQISIW